MQIMVTSNCVTAQLERALRLLIPDALISSVGFQSLIDPRMKHKVKRRMAEVDLVISLDWDEYYGDFAVDRIREWTQRCIIVPAVHFAGFHPDITYVKVGTGHNVSSPMTGYNSVIVMAGFLAGLTEARTVQLFNSLTYRRLGYFDAYEASKADLTAAFAAYGLDIAPLLPRWEQRGSFMHTVNHPKGFVVADIARLVCETFDIGRPLPTAYADFMGDDLVNGPIWPVYPEIGRALGMAGSYAFKTSAVSKGGGNPLLTRLRLVPPPRHVPERVLSLEQFVGESFAAYRETDPTGWFLPPRLEQAVAQFKALS